eukprot:787376_1
MLIYTVICRADGTVLTECTTSGMEGNFPQVTRVIIDYLKDRHTSINSGNGRTAPVESISFPEGNRRTFIHQSNESEVQQQHWGIDNLPPLCGGWPDLFYGDEDDDEEEVGSTVSPLSNYFHVFRKGDVFYLCF